MARLPRQKSKSDTYHIMLRGINRQTIFKDREDYIKFIETLKKYKQISCYQIYAYCLMSNHIHILMKSDLEDIGLVIKRIAGSYVYWYNLKYHRSGHLFQDRFKSEAVDDDAYFWTVLRYIHQNPLKANIIQKIDEYKYSSYTDYIVENRSFIDIDFIFSQQTKETFIDYHNQINDDVCLEVDDTKPRLNDNEVAEIIRKKLNINSPTELQKFNTVQLTESIIRLKNAGLSIRQIANSSGIKKSIVEKLSKTTEPSPCLKGDSATLLKI